MVKNLPASAGDLRQWFNPGLGRSPGKGYGNPLQYSCLENPMDRGLWRATGHGVTKLDIIKQLSMHAIRMDTCMTKSLCCSPKTVTTLLISYTPIENTFLKKISLLYNNRVIPLNELCISGVIFTEGHYRKLKVTILQEESLLKISLTSFSIFSCS